MRADGGPPRYPASRQTLVLVPGLLCDAAIWSEQIAALKPLHDIVVADVTRDDTIEAMAASVLAGLPQRFSVAGHSMGARVAIEMHRQQGSRIDRLALLDTGIHGVQPGEAEKRMTLVELSATAGMRALADRWLPPMVGSGHLDPESEPGRSLHAMVQRMNPAIHRRQINALLNRPDAREKLGAIACPVLIGVGALDQWSPPSQHRAIAALVPGAHYVEFEQAGHMAPLENAAAVNAALQHWMRLPPSA